MTDDVQLRYEHLGHRDTPARQKRRERLAARIQEIFDEPEARSRSGRSAMPDARCQPVCSSSVDHRPISERQVIRTQTWLRSRSEISPAIISSW